MIQTVWLSHDRRVKHAHKKRYQWRMRLSKVKGLRLSQEEYLEKDEGDRYVGNVKNYKKKQKLTVGIISFMGNNHHDEEKKKLHQSVRCH